MKTKKQIIKIIKCMRDAQKQKIAPKQFKTYMAGQINALNWVLEYKTTNKYYCIKCDLAHKELQCPKCGSVMG